MCEPGKPCGDDGDGDEGDADAERRELVLSHARAVGGWAKVPRSIGEDARTWALDQAAILMDVGAEYLRKGDVEAATYWTGRGLALAAMVDLAIGIELVGGLVREGIVRPGMSLDAARSAYRAAATAAVATAKGGAT